MGLPAAVRDRVAAVHRGSALPERLRLYDGWAARYEQDVAALEYRAPHLAAASLAFAFPAPHAEARLLDVACGTGLVARELHRRGFRCLHGVDGSAGMLERARSTGLYQDLRLCVLGRDPLPAPAEHYDAVTLVGALGEGQVPSTVLPELLRVTKPGTGDGTGSVTLPTARSGKRDKEVAVTVLVCDSLCSGGFLCLTTRSNPSNMGYKAELEAALGQLERSGAWQKLLAQEVEYWERAVTEEESTQGNGYISGVVYIYQKCPVPHLEEG